MCAHILGGINGWESEPGNAWQEKLTWKDETKVEIKGKGLTETVRKQQLGVANFEDCIQTYEKQMVTQRTIRSDHHILGTYEMRKVGLSAADDKRWIQADGISTLAHGHYQTRWLKVWGLNKVMNMNFYRIFNCKCLYSVLWLSLMYYIIKEIILEIKH